MTLVNQWYQILQHFITRDHLTLADLNEITQASTQTVKKNIRLLNEQLEQIARVTEDNQVYTLEIIDSQRFEIVMNGSLKQQTDFNSGLKRIAFLIDYFSQTDQYVVIDELAQQLEVSRSTVNKDLRHLKHLLADYQLSLIGTPNKGLILQGSESAIRMLYLYHAFDYLPQPTLPAEVLQVIQQVGLAKKLDIRTIGLLKKVITITLQRIRQQKTLTGSIAYYCNYFANDPTIEQLLVTIETSCNVTLSYYDWDFLCFPLNIFNNNAVSETLADNQVVKELFQVMMDRIHQAVIFSVDEIELFKKLRAHFMFLINRVIFRIQTIDIFGIEFKQKHAFSYELAEIGIAALADYLDKPPLENEISYLAVYFELLLKNDTHSKMKEIAVVCNTGKGTALMIKRQLANVLGPNIRISHYSEEEYETKDLDRYFAVFTTIPLKHTKATTSVIKLTDLFNDNWLLSEWKKIIAKKAVSFERFEFEFVQLDPQKEYQTNLTIILKQLEKQHLVDATFTSYILKKSQEDSAVIDNGIAFPHGINHATNKVVVSIGNYATPDPAAIELVFLVAIPVELTVELEDELLHFYDTMFAIAADRSLRQALKTVRSKAEYQELVTKGADKDD